MAPHSSNLAWKIPWTEETGRLQSMGSLRVRHDWATSLSLFTFMHWRRKWQPTPVFLPRESQGRDLTDVGNLISGSFAFCKSRLNIWKFMVQVLLKPSLKDFDLNLTSIWNEHSHMFEHYLALPLFGIGMKIDLFQSCGHCWVLQICCHIACSTLKASSFRFLK